VFHFSPNDVEILVLRPDNPTQHIRYKANSIGTGHAPTSPDHLRADAASVSDAGAVLITGPGNTKTELVEYIRLYDPKLVKVVAGVETVDHPSGALACLQGIRLALPLADVAEGYRAVEERPRN